MVRRNIYDMFRQKSYHESYRYMINKLCYLPNLNYFNLLSHSKLDKLNEILAH
jgi:hypothetical protein